MKPFQGVIGTWINQAGEMEECVLDMTILRGEHTGQNLAEALALVLDDFDLWGKIQGIATDNASNMDTFFKEFAKLYNSKVHQILIANFYDEF